MFFKFVFVYFFLFCFSGNHTIFLKLVVTHKIEFLILLTFFSRKFGKPTPPPPFFFLRIIQNKSKNEIGNARQERRQKN